MRSFLYWLFSLRNIKKQNVLMGSRMHLVLFFLCVLRQCSFRDYFSILFVICRLFKEGFFKQLISLHVENDQTLTSQFKVFGAIFIQYDFITTFVFLICLDQNSDALTQHAASTSSVKNLPERSRGV